MQILGKENHSFSSSFFTIHGRVSPWPISVNNTTATDMNIIGSLSGKGVPSANSLGKPSAMASDTMPRIPDQPMIRLFLKSSNASSVILPFLALNAFCRFIFCRNIRTIRIANATTVMANATRV